MVTSPAMDILAQIKVIEDVIVDPFFVVDAERTIVHFNRAFYSMLPRGVARGLKGKKLDEVLTWEIGGDDNCIVQRAWKAGKHLRLDEISGKIAKTDKALTFILSALPFFDEKEAPLGCLVVQRNVTDEAQVQVKYQEMLDNAKREREELKHVIRSRTKDLLETSQQLLAAQRELMGFKRGRIV